MNSTGLERQRGVSMLTLAQDKVNAPDELMVDRLQDQVRVLERDPKTLALVIAGQGRFFPAPHASTPP